jgi:hypothetical protein
MTPGTVFSDQNFRFHDGGYAKKILIVLGSANGTTVVAKTTSKSHRFSSAFGCQPNDRFQNFHLVENCCLLSKATWVCLDEYYELRDRKLVAKHFAGEVKHMGYLPPDITSMLVSCTLDSADLSHSQEAIVRAANT